MMNLSLSRTLLAVFVVCASQAIAQNKTVTLQANLDTAIFSNSGSLSSGKGVLVTGRTVRFGVRRALVSFDLAKSIPAGSKIVSVEFQMSSTKVSNTSPVSSAMHRVTAQWGEGTSNSTKGNGAAATAGDATWSHSVYKTKTWAMAGGDFAATASASAQTGIVARYSWKTTSTLVSDAQKMLDTPATNFGWLILTSETGKTATLWASREHVTSSLRPSLKVTYQAAVTASVASSGQGCAAGGRSLDHKATGLPKLGNGTFALNGFNGPPSGISIMFLAAGLQNPPIPLNNNKCMLYLSLLGLGPSFGTAFSTSGSVSYPFPIPNKASFSGIVFDTQIFSFGPGFTLRSSNALTMKIGN